MPLAGGTLRAPSLHLIIPSLHRRYPALRLLSFAPSIKHLSSLSAVFTNPTTEPSHSKSPHSTPPSSRTKHKPFSPNSDGSSQRHSIEQLPSNPNKLRTNQTKPWSKPSRRPKPNQTKSTHTTLGTRNVHRRDADANREVVLSVKKKRKEYRQSPAGLLQQNLDQCSKYGDTVRALELYDSAMTSGIPLTLRNYNCLLYLCSLPTSSSDVTSKLAGTRNGKGDRDGSDNALRDAEAKFNDPEISKMAVERGFEIYKSMCQDSSVEPNEATFTSMARLAAVKGDAHLAFDILKQMVKKGMPPKLRSYWPALHGFCDALDVEMAHEVETHMDAHGIVPEDADLAALLRANSTKGRADQVYRLLHKMRTVIRQVSEPTAEIIQSWFRSDTAAAVGATKWDIDKIKQGVAQGGGGWHGQGWLGSGHWRIERSLMSESGVCKSCSEKLICIDIDPLETEAFAKSLIELPYFKENRDEFLRFESWLRKKGPFDAVIDAANVGLCNQREFKFSQVNSVIRRIRELSPSKKMPLIILHQRRLYDDTARDPRNRRIIESWKNAGCLYPSPRGSNDDWYWLYAAVSNKCLLVTNDEMRDHLFQLLGTSFFPRWKEKHQVRMTFSSRGLTLHMPPPYSIVIQESETGNWHIPTTTGDDLEMPRQWICVTRDMSNSAVSTTTAASFSLKKVGSTSATSSIDKMKPTQQVGKLSQLEW